MGAGEAWPRLTSGGKAAADGPPWPGRVCLSSFEGSTFVNRPPFDLRTVCLEVRTVRLAEATVDKDERESEASLHKQE